MIKIVAWKANRSVMFLNLSSDSAHGQHLAMVYSPKLGGVFDIEHKMDSADLSRKLSVYARKYDDPALIAYNGTDHCNSVKLSGGGKSSSSKMVGGGKGKGKGTTTAAGKGKGKGEGKGKDADQVTRLSYFAVCAFS